MKPLLRAPSSVVASLALALAAMPTLGCKPGANAAGQIAQNPTMEATGQAKCGVKKSQAKPLVVEWPAAERGALEARAQRGLVAVRYNGCEMEVLTTCRVDVPYDYIGITQKNEAVRIKDYDELYANLPVGAAKLEAKLEKSGQLNVDMTIVGRYESPRVHIDERDLNGRCEGATHVITGLTTGAFVFYSGAAAEVGAGVEVAGVAGGGASSTSEKELLNQDGDLEACKMAQVGDAAPPPGCGALLRVEVVPVDRSTSSAPQQGTLGTVLGTKPKDDGTTPDMGWSPQKEAQLRNWRIITVTSGVLFLGAGGASLAGLFLPGAADDLDNTVPNPYGGNEVLVPGDADRQAVIRNATIKPYMIWGGVVGLYAFGILGAVGLARIRKLAAEKAKFQGAAIVPIEGGAAATLEMRF